MAKFYLRLLTLILTFSLLSTTAFAAFTDTSGHWAETAIDQSADLGLFNGTGNGAFSPDAEMTRGMFVTGLGRLAASIGLDLGQSSSSFSDVSESDYYAPYVAWANRSGIVYGNGNGNFFPNNPISREQMCTIFIRFLDLLKYDIPETDSALDFFDKDQISSYAVSNVNVAVGLGLIKGIETTSGLNFMPLSHASRAEVVTVFIRLNSILESYEQDPTVPSGKSSNSDNTGHTPSSSDTKPTPEGPEHTEAEIAEEKEMAGYLSAMLSAYKKSSYKDTVDSGVKDCMDTLMNCISSALNSRKGGVFLTSDYVRETYADDIENVRNSYHAMDENLRNQAMNVIVRLESTEHIYIVMDYFGVSL